VIESQRAGSGQAGGGSGPDRKSGKSAP